MVIILQFRGCNPIVCVCAVFRRNRDFPFFKNNHDIISSHQYKYIKFINSQNSWGSLQWLYGNLVLPIRHYLCPWFSGSEKCVAAPSGGMFGGSWSCPGKNLNMTPIKFPETNTECPWKYACFAKSKFTLTKPRFLKFKILVFQRVVLPNINFSCQFQGVNDPRPQVPQWFWGSQLAEPGESDGGSPVPRVTPWRIHGTIAYLPTWMVDFYGKLVGKYTINTWILWDTLVLI